MDTHSRRSSHRRDSIGTIGKRRKHRRHQEDMTLVLIIAAAVVLIAGLIFGIVWLVKDINKNKGGKTETETVTTEVVTGTDATETETEETTSVDSYIMDMIEQADTTAAMYDYDGAIALLQSIEGYEDLPALTDKIAEYEDSKSKLVKWADNTQITHIFFHSLIMDDDLAFNSDDANNYNQVMTTKYEFDKIIETMYEEGYVLVTLHDIAEMTTQEDGTTVMTWKAIYLPEGKKPFVLSEDDVCYYDYMTGDGFANKLVVAEDGSVDTTMVMSDGTTQTGSFDVVPLIDDFVEEHPDFSYHGSKGIVAVTGYEGIFGYDTSEYSFGATNPDYYTNPNIEADRQTASQVAQALKDTGWEIASHSWGHPDLAECSWDRFVWDCDMWNTEVSPLIGGTDIMIYPKGADVGSWRGYYTTNDDGTVTANERYQYMKDLGFDYFCNVDSTPTWVQLNNNYFRMGRRNLDGQRLYEALVATDRVSDLFNAADIIDPDRPLPVPGVTPTEASTEGET